MFLSSCIIVKDDSELPKLEKCVLSFIDYVDEVIITANGKEASQIERFCSLNPKIKYYYLKWNDDFAEQRNYCAAQIHPKADFYLWADSDDVIVNAHLLRDLAQVSKSQGYDTVFFDYWYGNKFEGEPSEETFIEPELVQKRERLINPRKVIWKKRIHETPVPIDGDNFRYSRVDYSKDHPIAWLHLGADRDMKPEELEAKMQRNRRLLEMELQDERSQGEADPRTLLYLMKIYAESDVTETLETCLEMGKEYMERSGWDLERSVCLQLMAKCVGKLGMDDKARDILLNALKEYPYDPLLYLYLARTYFNLGNYRAMKHWMQLGLNLNIEDNNAAMTNLLEMKILSAELMLEYYLKGEKDIRKAYQSAKLLNSLNPTENNAYNEEYLFNQKRLDEASEQAHKLIQYLEDIQQESLIPQLIQSLPQAMQDLPFANKYFHKYAPAKVWGDKEICYYASFGGPHFEKWDGNSLKQGIGGSETAVIRLSEEWTKLGYKVTVYCDPVTETEINGVRYVPYYKFNPKDHFNIFIQWRASNLANRISAKKFYVDLHDVFFAETHLNQVEAVDKFLVKSKYHRGLAPEIGDTKFKEIPNGI